MTIAALASIGFLWWSVVNIQDPMKVPVLPRGRAMVVGPGLRQKSRRTAIAPRWLGAKTSRPGSPWVPTDPTSAGMMARRGSRWTTAAGMRFRCRLWWDRRGGLLGSLLLQGSEGGSCCARMRPTLAGTTKTRRGWGARHLSLPFVVGPEGRLARLSFAPVK